MVEQRSPTVENHFLNDVRSLRESAKTLMDQPIAAQCDQSGAPTFIELLQTVLRTEIVCVLRYTDISISPAGLKNARVGVEFQEQANDERRHMTMIAQRIVELGGTPNFNSMALLSRGSAALDDHHSLAVIAQQNLLAEGSVVEHYRDLIDYFLERDPRTGSILENILLDEENHVADMHDLLFGDCSATIQ